jgi:D-alanyl-D-alanine carboxypeptidase
MVTGVLASAIEHIDSWLEDHRQRLYIPGVAIALTNRQELLFEREYGLANLDSGEPLNPEHLFQFGSIGKTFTSIAILQLAEEGKLDLDDEVSTHLPWFAVRSAYESIRIWHLLSHTAGIILGSESSPSTVSELAALRHTATGFPPGSHFHYSNVGYKALGLIAAARSGRAYGSLIKHFILDPLGMLTTEQVIAHHIHSRLAVGYEPLFDDRPHRPGAPLIPATWFENDSGDGSLSSNASDLATFARMLLNRGRGDTSQVISEESFESMTSPVIHAPDSRPDAHYGYGLRSALIDGHFCVYNGGDVPGYSAFLICDLDAGLAVTVLINGPGDPGAIGVHCLAVARATLEGRPTPNPPTGWIPDLASLGEYGGVYLDQVGERVEITVGEECLRFELGNIDVPLVPYGPDVFFVDHPTLSRFALQFQREHGSVRGASHGESWWTRAGHQPPVVTKYPAEWNQYVGHYRSWNPWGTNFRILPRNGWLFIDDPLNLEEPLHPLDDDRFRIGSDEWSPERIRFSMELDGVTLHADRSGCVYHRVFA